MEFQCSLQSVSSLMKTVNFRTCLIYLFFIASLKKKTEVDRQNLPYLLASFSVQLATVYEMSEKTFSEREQRIPKHGY